MIFIEILWESFDVKEAVSNGTWTLRPSSFHVYDLTNWVIGPTMELKHSR